MGLNLQGIVLYLCWQDFTFFGRKRDANALLIPEIALTLWPSFQCVLDMLGVPLGRVRTD